MKVILLSALPLVCLSCSSPSLKERDALDAHQPKPATPLVGHDAPITTSTKFVAKCPYDGTPAISKSTLTSSVGTVNGTNVQTWTITFVCPRDGMIFTDTRVQCVPETRSLRLPIIGTGGVK